MRQPIIIKELAVYLGIDYDELKKFLRSEFFVLEASGRAVSSDCLGVVIRKYL